jgi:hypothetical protein
MTAQLRPDPGAMPEVFTLDDLESDSSHVEVMMDVLASGFIEDFSSDKVPSMTTLEKYGALMWITRDLVESLHAKLALLNENAALRGAMTAIKTPQPASQPSRPQGRGTLLSCLLDAGDALAMARDLVELINMTGRKKPDDDQKAIGAGCDAALEKIAAVRQLLEEARTQCQPN